MATLIKNPPAPGTPEWRRMITASKIPAILGIDPYQSQGDLWMEMSDWAEPETTDTTKEDMFLTGHTLEAGLAEYWAAKHPGWQLNRPRGRSREIAYTDTSLDFPNLATLDARPRRGRAYHRLEFKTSASVKKWGDPGTELPADVAAQTIWQAGVSGIEDGDVVAIVSGDRPLIPRIYNAPGDKELFEGIAEYARAFYRSLQEEVPPEPPADLIDGITRVTLNLDKDDVEELPDGDPDLVHLRDLDAQLAELKQQRDTLAESIMLAAGNRHITVDGKKITRLSKGRFSQSRIPAEAKYLMKDPEVLTPKFDAKKFTAKYPQWAEAATGDDTLTIPALK